MTHRAPKSGPAEPLTAEERAERDRLVQAVQEKLAHADRTFYEVGRILLDLRDRRLYREEGSFESFVRRRFGFSRQRAYALIDLGRNFAPERAAEGEAKLRAGLAYLRATPAEDRPADLDGIVFEVPRDGKIERLRWKEAIADDIERATAQLRRRLRRESGDIPRSLRSYRRQIEHRVRGVRVGFRQRPGHTDAADVEVTLVSPFPRLAQLCRTSLELLRRLAGS